MTHIHTSIKGIHGPLGLNLSVVRGSMMYESFICIQSDDI